mgnify:CR=1 FL=1
MRHATWLLCAILFTGCASHAPLVDALAKDRATFCADLTGVYLGASLRTRIYRTGVQELGGTAESSITVTCKDDGMTVTRSRVVEPARP